VPQSVPASPAFPTVAVESWTREILTRAGLTSEDASVVARSLLFADERGISTHGVARVPLYLIRLRHGGIVASARPELVADAGALCIVDGRGAAGAVTAALAVRHAAARAHRHGTGICLVRGGNDFGAAGYHASRLAELGCLGLVACNSDAVMCAPGAATRVLGTNPLALSVPGTWLVLDMATSAAAYGKVVTAAAENRAIPLGWGVDKTGRETSDPRQVLDGGCVLPAAGPKGFGLAFMIDVFAALAGAHTSPFVPSVEGQPSVPQNLGMVFIAVDAERCSEPSAFQAGLSGLISAVHATFTANAQRAMAPGEPEEMRRTSLGAFIEVPSHLICELSEVGRQMGTPFPPPADAARSKSREERR
jgi:LDH2 family malate/lactate/ureidoglycolate dehydrogenase